MSKWKDIAIEQLETNKAIAMAELERDRVETKRYVRTINIFGKEYPVANLGGNASAEAIKFERDLFDKFAE